MPFNNYSELIDEVVDLIGRSRFRTKIPGWIQLAEREAVIEIRDLSEVRYKTTGTFVLGEDTITLPDGVRGIDGFQIDTSPIRTVRAASLKQVMDQRAVDTAGAENFPLVYAFTAEGVIEMAPAPGQTDNYTLYYVGGMIDVTPGKYTSNILEHAPHYLLYRAAYHAAKYTRNAEQQASFGPEAADMLVKYGRYLARIDKKSIQVGRNVSPRDYPQTTGSF